MIFICVCVIYWSSLLLLIIDNNKGLRLNKKRGLELARRPRKQHRHRSCFGGVHSQASPVLLVSAGLPFGLAFFGTRALQNVRMGRMTHYAANIEIDRDLVHQVRILVNDRDFMLLARKAAGNALAYPAGTTDQDVHQFSLSALRSGIVPHACCYAQSL